MKLKSISIALLSAGWMLSSAFAFTTADNASQAPVAKPQAPVVSATGPKAANPADAGASKVATGHEKNAQPTRPSALGNGGK